MFLPELEFERSELQDVGLRCLIFSEFTSEAVLVFRRCSSEREMQEFT
ncbi:hypothetical protein J3A69_000912 [Pseudomonas putida]|nr:hypothetical protein [Pseudomonas sp. PvP089]MBP2086534.1 hypothetical protein [Pseudomonas sp. PvP088]MBP2221305.1 hypothetical protein [Pseudomonas putida]